jgi:TorA maturation chaperone TorD
MASGRAALVEAAALLDTSRLAAEPLLKAARAFADSVPADAAGLTAPHARLFGHSQGLVCPFETEYGSGGSFRQPQELADIAGFYLAFGLRASAGADERADHVACECEFMGFLARKEAFVLASTREPDGIGASEAEEMQDVVLRAAAGFLRDHLARFGLAFATRLVKESGGGFFGALGGVLIGLLHFECERLGVPAGAPTLQVRPPALDDVPMGCGTACGAETGPIPIEIRGRP